MKSFTEGLRSSSDVNPMKLLQLKALEMANLSYDRAFSIDNSDIGGKVGEFYITILVDKFYTKVYEDKEEWFRLVLKLVINFTYFFIISVRSQFRSPKEESSQNLSDFLIQRIGGPPYYSERKGFPSLIQRHASFEMSEAGAERWLTHMNESLNEMEDDIEEKYRIELSDFLRYTAYFLLIAHETQKTMELMGPGA